MRPLPLRLVLCGLGAIAWMILLTRDAVPMVPGWCGGDGTFGPAMLPQLFGSMLRVTSLPDELVRAGLMLAAMMVPLVLEPLERVRRRGGSATLFLTGYCALWLPAILLLGLCSTAFRLATLGHPLPGIAAVGALILLWHATPLRARCLASCQRGPDDRGSLRSGMRQAAGCIGACSAAMTLPPLFGPAHLAAMAVVTALLWHERRTDAGRRSLANAG